MKQNSSYRALTSIISLVLLFSSLLGACSKVKSYANTPQGVTQKMLDSIQELDANKYLDSISPQDRTQPGYFFYRQIAEAIFSSVNLGSLDVAKPKVGFTDMVLKEIDNNGSVAHVSANGKVRDLNLAIEQNFSTTITVVKIDNTWLCQLNNTNTDNSVNSNGTNSGNSSVSTPLPKFTGVGMFSSDNQWLFLPFNSIVWMDDSTRSGWKGISVNFDVINYSAKLLPYLGCAAFGYVTITSNNNTYFLETKDLTTTEGSGTQFLHLPPSYGISCVANGEIPNITVEGMANLIQNISKISVQFPIATKQDTPGQNTFLRAVTENIPFEAQENNPNPIPRPGIGENQKLGGYADITLKSASFDLSSKTWQVSINIKNDYGQDIDVDSIYLYVVNPFEYSIRPDYGLGSRNNLIPPGQNKDISDKFVVTFTGYNNSQNIFTGFPNNQLIVVYNDAYAIFSLGKN